MFVAFEGIDGSGKSAVSGRVADALRQRGLDVYHARPDGDLDSPLAEQIRQIGRDRRHLFMAPITELLLSAAREAQVLAASIRPESERRDVVISDRSMHSWRNLAVRGRGLEPDRADAICAAAAGGLWPDLVVLLDTDPQLARARRKAQKIARRGPPSTRPPKGRKGLAGVALQHRLRRGYLDLAAGRDDWLVIDNTGFGNTLPEISDQIAEHIAARLAGPSPSPPVSRAAGRSSPPAGDLAALLEWASDRLYALIGQLVDREPQLAAYLTARLADERAYQYRRALRERAPANVAASLRGLADEAAWALREALAETVPGAVARSLRGRQLLGHPRAAELRERLAGRAPEEVLATLGGDDSEAAWALRDRLEAAHPAAALESLRRVDSAAAREMRRRYRPADHGRALLVSVRGIDSEEAWALREAITDQPVVLLRSVDGIDSARAWRLRERLGPGAPRALFSGLVGIDSEAAWALREAHLESVKEVLDSLARLDSERAWDMRRRGVSRFPSTALKSMVSVAPLRGERAALAAEVLAAAPDNVSLLGHAARLFEIEDRTDGRCVL